MRGVTGFCLFAGQVGLSTRTLEALAFPNKMTSKPETGFHFRRGGSAAL